MVHSILYFSILFSDHSIFRGTSLGRLEEGGGGGGSTFIREDLPQVGVATRTNSAGVGPNPLSVFCPTTGVTPSWVSVFGRCTLDFYETSLSECITRTLMSSLVILKVKLSTVLY